MAYSDEIILDSNECEKYLKKYKRYKNRVSFISESGLYKIDMTQVLTRDKVSYETEVELIRPKVISTPTIINVLKDVYNDTKPKHVFIDKNSSVSFMVKKVGLAYPLYELYFCDDGKYFRFEGNQKFPYRQQFTFNKSERLFLEGKTFVTFIWRGNRFVPVTENVDASGVSYVEMYWQYINS